MADGSNSHNLFGIKAGKDWNGKVAEVTTTEYHNGVASQQVRALPRLWFIRRVISGLRQTVEQ